MAWRTFHQRQTMLSTIMIILSTVCLLSFFHISVYALLQRVIIGNTKEKGQVLGASLLKLQHLGLAPVSIFIFWGV